MSDASFNPAERDVGSSQAPVANHITQATADLEALRTSMSRFTNVPQYPCPHAENNQTFGPHDTLVCNSA